MMQFPMTRHVFIIEMFGPIPRVTRGSFPVFLELDLLSK